jgi:hypothetical protein
LIEHITPEDLKEIVTALLTQAKAGDIASSYCPYLIEAVPMVFAPM